MPKNAKAIAGVLLIFILGAVTGALVTHMVHQRNFAAFMHGGPRMREEFIVTELNRELQLDDRQQGLIRGIVQETHAAIREMRGQMRPKVEILLEQGNHRISEILTPAQQEKFLKLTAERKAHRNREKHGPMPH